MLEIRDNFYLNGEPFKIISGAFHYFRTVPEYWQDRIEKLVNMGCNTVETYIPWNFHEPEKGNFRFAPLMYLEVALANIDKMPQSTFDEIIEKYAEMNIAHPFREGNGRSTRIWLDHILKTEIGKVMDWSKVDKEDYLLAMERSPIKDVEIKVLLKSALTDEINSREVYMIGIDHSYFYEGYTTFKAEDLSKE